MIPLGSNSSPTSHPSPVCLSLSSSPSLPLSPSGLVFLLSAYPSLRPLLLLFLRLHRQIPRILAKFARVRSPLFGEATLHLLVRLVLEWSAKPSQHPTACITASVQLMNTTEGMCQCPSPAFFCLISFTLNRGTVYNGSVRNKERTYPVR